MKPSNFRQSNKTLTKPLGMTEEECGSLPVWTDDERCLSLWKGTWRDRLLFLIKGEIWLWVWSGHTQPPVSVTTIDPW